MILEQEHIVKLYEVDFNKNLTLFSILNIMQEYAETHAKSHNFGTENLIENNTTWVLSRLAIQIDKLPKLKDVIKIRTWSKGYKGFFALRDYCFVDKDDNTLIKVTTAWLIIDLETKKITRNRPQIDSNITLENRHAIKDIPSKINKLVDPDFKYTKTIHYSDIDLNLHTNNAKYVENILNCFSLEYFTKKRIKHFQINYLAETKINDKIDNYLLQDEKNSDKYFIEGKKEGEGIFISSIKFTNLK